MMKKKYLVLVSVIALMCTGCGNTRKPVDITTEGEQATLTDTSPTEESNWGEFASEEMTVKQDSVSGAYPVVSISDKEYSEEDVKAVAADLFDGGEYEALLPYECWTRQELQSLYDEYEDIVEFETPDYYTKNQIKWAAYSALESYDEANVSQAGKTFYDIIDSEGNTRRKAWLSGDCDGKPSYLTVEETDGQYSFSFYYTDSMPCMALADGVDETVVSDMLYEGENQCEYSAEEAEDYALDFLTHFTDGTFEVKDIAETACTVEGQDGSGMMKNGYYVYLQRTVGDAGMAFAASPLFLNSANPYSGMYEYDYSNEENQEFVCVYVTSRGVEDCKYYNPIEVNEVLTEKSELLDEKSISDILNQTILEESKKESHEDILLNLTEAELGLWREGDSLIPVYVFFEDAAAITHSFYVKSPVVIINAIDGSVLEKNKTAITLDISLSS